MSTFVRAMGALCLLLAILPVAHAQQSFDELVAEGYVAYESGDFDEAIELFLKARLLQDEPDLTYNIARAFHQKGDCQRAVKNYKEYKAHFQADPKRFAKVDEYVKELGECPTTGVLSMTCNPSNAQVKVDARELGVCGDFELPPGEHTVVVMQEGYLPQDQQITLELGQVTSLVVSLDLAPDAGDTSDPTAAADDTDTTTGGGSAGNTGGSPTPPEVIPVPSSGPRFRWSTAGQLGAFIAPILEDGVSTDDATTYVIGVVGFTSELGIQITDLVGLYTVGSVDILFGPVAGINATLAFILDFTFFNDMITVGAGFDMGGLAGFSASSDGIGGAVGAGYGGRLRFSWNADVWRDEEGDRGSLIVGLDLRFLVGAFAAGDTSGSGQASYFFFSPMAVVGYRGF